MTHRASANVPPMMQRRDGSPKADTCASRCRPNRTLISLTCLPPMRPRLRRCAMSHDLVRSVVSLAPEMTAPDTWPEPAMRLVSEARPTAPTLYDLALPAGWEAWITAEAAACACPRDYIAAGLIGAASAWIGNARRVAATADWNEPAHLWLALIRRPS